MFRPRLLPQQSYGVNPTAAHDRADQMDLLLGQASQGSEKQHACHVWEAVYQS